MSARSRLSLGAAAIAGLVLVACAGIPAPLPTGTASAPPRTTRAAKGTATPIATWTLEPVTPTATATPTATPTPIIYAVQQGDTLLEIAKQFNAKASEIQEVNGITDPRSLQIGQELIIPAGDEDAIAATATATPMPVHAAAVTYNRTNSGDLVVVGEVVNDSTAGVEEVMVTVELLNDEGDLVKSVETLALRDVIEVGGRAPFGTVIPQAPDFAQVRCRVTRARPEVPERAIHRGLVVTEVSGRAVYDRTFVVIGKARNGGEVAATELYVTATLYGRDGAVIGALRQVVPGVLEPGSRALFQVTIVPIGWPVESFVVVAEGRQVLPTSTPEPTSTPQ